MPAAPIFVAPVANQLNGARYLLAMKMKTSRTLLGPIEINGRRGCLAFLNQFVSMCRMYGPEGLPSLATLSLEAFPSGDAVRRRATEFSMRKRLSGASDEELAAIGAASERLMDPVGRFEESLSWLMLPEGTVRRVMDAAEPWPQRLAGLREAVARHSAPECRSHNELVLVGLASLLEPSGQVAQGAVASIARLSADVVGQEPFWAMVLAQVRAIGDPRLNSSVVPSARSAYQARALGPALSPLQAELRSHQASGARAALAAMVEAKLPERVLSDVRAALFGDILLRCEQAIAELEPRAGATKTRAEHEEVLKQARDRLDRDVSLLQQLGDAGGESCRRVRDSYAELLRTLAIRGVNVHEMHAEAETLAARAQSLAAGSGLRARLADDVKTLEENAKYRKCVYCKTAEADGKPVERSLFRVTARHFNSVSYQSLQVPVPRCRGCESKQAKAGVIYTVGSVLGVIGGVAVGIALDSGETYRRHEPCAGILFGGAVGGAAGFVLCMIVTHAMGLSDSGSAEDFPPLKQLLAEGWKFGVKPGKGD